MSIEIRDNKNIKLSARRDLKGNKKIRVLNLYCGIGGNRLLWPKSVEVTAIENNPKIAEIYQNFFPNDKVIVADAHQYLLEYFKEFDFIWSSPPCPSHSQFRFRCGVRAWNYKPLFPDMRLYEEIIFLQHHFEGLWVVENVESYYKPLIQPCRIQRHYFWSNFHIHNINIPADDIRNRSKKSLKEKYKQYGFDLSNYSGVSKMTLLNNCVNSKLGLHIFQSATGKMYSPLVTGGVA